MAQGIYIPKFQEGGGVSIAGLLGRSAQNWAAKNIAKKDIKQRKKESKWAGLMALLKPVAAFAAKGALGLAGIGSGGLLAPLLLGGGTAAISKLFDVIGRKGFKAGADPSKIEATGKYGFGKEYAKTLSEGLVESIKKRDPLSGENIAADVVGAYVSALTPKLGVDPETGKMGVEGGKLGENIMGAIKGEKGKLSLLDLQEEGLIPKGLANIKHSKMISEMDKLYGGDYSDTFKDVQLGQGLPLSKAVPETNYLSQISQAEVPSPMLFPSTAPGLGSNLGWREAADRGEIPQYDEFGSWGAHVGMSPQEVAAKRGQRSPFSQSLDESPTDWESYYQALPSPVEEFDPYEMQQGGQVPSQSPTISDYFGKQGKTLGGSNTQSLSQMLGRK